MSLMSEPDERLHKVVQEKRGTSKSINVSGQGGHHAGQSKEAAEASVSKLPGVLPQLEWPRATRRGRQAVP